VVDEPTTRVDSWSLLSTIAIVDIMKENEAKNKEKRRRNKGNDLNIDLFD